MVQYNEKLFTKSEIADAIAKARTMGGAAKLLQVDWRTFKKEAIKHGLYKPQRKMRSAGKFLMKDILEGKHPEYATTHIRKRLLSEGIKPHICESCGKAEWLNQPIPLECHHENGDNSDHRLENLKLICPNCHSMTDTYRSKNTFKRKSG